jgi:3-isopropylmalate dehydratase small subunit
MYVTNKNISRGRRAQEQLKRKAIAVEEENSIIATPTTKANNLTYASINHRQIEENNCDAYNDINYNEQFDKGESNANENFTFSDSTDNIMTMGDEDFSDNYYSLIECTVPDFSIKKTSHYFLSKLLKKSTSSSNHHQNLGIRLIGNSGVLKGSFARAFSNICSDNSILPKAQEEILNLFFNSTKGTKTAINLPVLPVKKKDEFNRNKHNDDEDTDGDGDDKESIKTLSTIGLEEKNVHIDIDTCIQEKESQRFISIAQCENDCFVYAGDQNRLEFNCITCKSPRYLPCSRSTCNGRSSTNCEHLRVDGVPNKKLFYRPILVLLADCLRTPYFLKALNYASKRFDCDTTCYIDLMDGSVPKFHLQQMKNRFHRHCDKQEVKDSNTIKEVSILVSEFYDGGQLFKSHADYSFWGLFLGILNLPPSFRGKLGISYFILSLYAGKHAAAEKFLLIDCLCEELNMLYDGVEQMIDGQMYFIQVRLILHVLDSRAVEPLLQLQSSSNSKQGCPLCGCLNGLYIRHKCVYIGLRHTLSLNHWLRQFGQSGKCCPKNFYNRNYSDQWYKSNEQSFLSSTQVVSAIDMLLHQTNKKVISKRCYDFCMPCNEDESVQRSIKDFLNDDNSKFDWYHDGDFEFGDIFMDREKGLRKYLYYRHFDFRPVKEFTRISNEDHLTFAKEARKQNQIIARRNVEKGTKRSKTSVYGIQDIWAFNRLPYSDIANQVDWPVQHCISGVTLLIINLMFGQLSSANNRHLNEDEDGIIVSSSASSSQIYEQTDYNCSDELNIGKKEPIYRPNEAFWESSIDHRGLSHAWLNCILLPPDLYNDFNLDNFISIDGKVVGNANMQQKLKVFLCLMDIILFTSDIKQPYQFFYRLLANDIRKLLNVVVQKSSVDNLGREMLETISLAEGLFPPNIFTIQLHQLTHLAQQIHKFGPLLGVSEFPGERAVGEIKSIKKKANMGGRSFEEYILERQVKREIMKLKKFYRKDICSKLGTANSFLWYHIGNDNTLMYNERPFHLSSMEKYSKRNVLLNAFETECLIEVILLELHKGGVKNCLLIDIVNARNNSDTLTAWLSNVSSMQDDELEDVKLTIKHRSVATELSTINVCFFKNAYIYGEKFRSRGSEFRQTTPATKGSVINTYNEGKVYDSKQWVLKNWYRSWCKYTYEINNVKEDLYGHLNGFFKLESTDEFVSGLMLASVTGRRFYNSKSKNRQASVDFVRIKNSYYPRNLFLSIADIYPSQIGTIPLDYKQRPIEVPFKNRTSKEKYFSYEPDTMQEFAMIVLKPEKISLRPTNTYFKQFHYCNI